MQRLNVEIKAICRDPEWVRNALLSRNANFIGEDHQVDTYFQVNQGRLKLREGKIEHALIHYNRPNQTGPKASDVLLYHPELGSSLKPILTRALGVLTVVDKKRSIFFIDNVKFHIDRLEGWGNFVEIEAIDMDGSHDRQELLAQCRKYMAILNIAEEDLLEDSYSDMILSRQLEKDSHS